MTADTLRRAAALMRERAEAATGGRWAHDTEGAVRSTAIVASGSKWTAKRYGGCVVNRPSNPVDGSRANANADHIASWHPAVALAVADLLDAHADAELGDGYDESRDLTLQYLLRIARAYLGESS